MVTPTPTTQSSLICLDRQSGSHSEHMLNIIHDIGSLALLFFSSAIFSNGSIIGAFLPGVASIIQGFCLAKTMVNNQNRSELLDELETIIKPAVVIQYIASLFFTMATFTGTVSGGLVATGTFAGLSTLFYYFSERIFHMIDHRL